MAFGFFFFTIAEMVFQNVFRPLAIKASPEMNFKSESSTAYLEMVLITDFVSSVANNQSDSRTEDSRPSSESAYFDKDRKISGAVI